MKETVVKLNNKIIILTICILGFFLPRTLNADTETITKYEIVQKNGNSFEVSAYEKIDNQYCFYRSHGQVCIPESSVATIKENKISVTKPDEPTKLDFSTFADWNAECEQECSVTKYSYNKVCWDGCIASKRLRRK